MENLGGNMSEDNTISTNKFLRELRKEVDRLGGPVEAGRVWGISYQHISSALSTAKLPIKSILTAMGYESVKEIKYRYKAVK
jgi:hypothetical protein